MRFLPRPWNSQYPYYPKLLGTYELELHPWIDKILRSDFDQVIIAGAAEGYYAVGLAWRRVDWKVRAFDAQPQAAEALIELAKLNGTEDRITLLGLCDIPAFSAVLETVMRPFILLDVEGAEALLLDPRVLPKLIHASILVELHENMIPRIGAIVRDRFRHTHKIAEVVQEPRRLVDFPMKLHGLHAAYLGGAAVQLMAEYRPRHQSWLLLLPA
jgi:hypothetical protein